MKTFHSNLSESSSPESPGLAAVPTRRFDYWPWVLVVGVLACRIATRGSVYFADGPALIKAVQTGVFVIQPPGYWLFLRAASLFPNPALGMSLMNWSFSAAGAATLYYCARLLVEEWTAKLGSVLYAVIFYAWFSGDVQSTYASQLLVPALIFLLLVLHHREGRLRYLLGASVAFGLGAGLRPSDGAFVGFLFLYYLLRHAPRTQAIISFSLAALICAGWLVPTALRYESLGGLDSAGRYVASVTTQVSLLFTGPTRNSLANLARFAVPLVFAFGPLLPFVLAACRDRGRIEVQLLCLWIIPGALFLSLCYMSDAPYLDFLTAGVLLLALVGLRNIARPRKATLLGLCIVWNAALFLCFQPIFPGSLPFAVIDAYAGRYTRYAIIHKWEPKLGGLQPALRSVLGTRGLEPGAAAGPAAGSSVARVSERQHGLSPWLLTGQSSIPEPRDGYDESKLDRSNEALRVRYTETSHLQSIPASCSCLGREVRAGAG